MATYTCTTFNAQPKQVHAGVNSVSGVVTIGPASSVGDIVFLAKVPHGAKYVHIQADHTSGAAAMGVDYGLSTGGPGGAATLSCYISAGATNTVLTKNVAGIPADVSNSDTDPNRFGILSAKVASGSMTVSLQIAFVFTYRVDGAGN